MQSCGLIVTIVDAMAKNLSLEYLVEKLESLIASVYSEDPDGKKLCLAVNELENEAQNNFAEFMHSLSVILASYGKYSIAARRGAALQLKQSLTNKDANLRGELVKRWLAVPAKIRNTVKSNILTALNANQNSRPNNSSQVVAFLASAESPISSNWPGLIPSLCTMIITNRDEEKEGPVEALAFVCKELDIELLGHHAESINAAILTCFQITKSSDCTRLAALICLLECFDFAKDLLANDETYPLLMANICHSAKSLCSEIRVGGLAVLVKVATHQYELLKEVMDEIETITIEAIRSNHQRTHIQALEFWKAVSQSETPRDSEGRLINDRGNVSGYGFSLRALGKLVPALLHVLRRGDFIQNTAHGGAKHRSYFGNPDFGETSNESHDKPCSRVDSIFQKDHSLNNKDKMRYSASKVCMDNWVPPKEVIIYLSELCENFSKAIDMHILPNVPSKIRHENWKERNVALWSFLVFLQQMKQKHAKKVLPNYFPLIVNAVQDKKSSRIRNTALWVVSWMLDKCPWLVIFGEQKFQKKLVSLLISCLHDEEGRVAPTSCITIASLVRASYVLAIEQAHPNLKPQTFQMSPFYDQIADALVAACNRRLAAAFEALRQVLIMAPDDCYWVVLDTFDTLLAQLRKMVALPELHPAGCDCHETVQQILCAVLCSVFKSMRYNEEPTIQLAWKFLKCVKNILKLFPHGKAREDAMLAASTIVAALDWKVKDHLSWEKPLFLIALNPESNIDMKICNL